MRTFSRWMPPAPVISRATQIGWLVVLLATAGWFIVRYPWLPVAAVAVLALADLLAYPRRQRLARMAQERAGESLCTFARAFRRDQRDPWILRATYEELQSYCTVGKQIVPLRPTDRWHQDYGIDPNAFDDIGLTIAQRVGLDMRQCKRNPYYGRVETVGDLVAFMRALPRKVAA